MKKEITCTFAYLTIKNANFCKNFRFKVLRPSNSLIHTASVYIKKRQFQAHKIALGVGDKLYLSLQNNKEAKVLIFSGEITSINSTVSELHLEAVYKVTENTVFNETFKDTKLENALSYLLSNIHYEASDKEYPQLIFRGNKFESLNRLLNKKSFFIDLAMNLVVRDDPKSGNSYIVDECLHRVKSNEVVIFPIPQLEIHDVIEFHGQKYIIKGISYHYLSKATMVLDLAPFIGITPPLIDVIEEVPKEILSKPVDEAMLYFENPKKIR